MAYLVFAPCAAVVAGLPGFLFTTGMFGMEFEANMILYVAVTAITAFLLGGGAIAVHDEPIAVGRPSSGSSESLYIRVSEVSEAGVVSLPDMLGSKCLKMCQ